MQGIAAILNVLIALMWGWSYASGPTNPSTARLPVRNRGLLSSFKWTYLPAAALCLLLVVGTLISQPGLDSPTVRIASGSFMSVLGVLLSLWAKRMLGASYSPCYAAAPPARLVASGPYAFLSHPIYVGNLLILGGWFVQSLSIVILGVWLHWAAAYVVSARVESGHSASTRGN